MPEPSTNSSEALGNGSSAELTYFWTQPKKWFLKRLSTTMRSLSSYILPQFSFLESFSSLSQENTLVNSWTIAVSRAD